MDEIDIIVRGGRFDNDATARNGEEILIRARDTLDAERTGHGVAGDIDVATVGIRKNAGEGSFIGGPGEDAGTAGLEDFTGGRAIRRGEGVGDTVQLDRGFEDRSTVDDEGTGGVDAAGGTEIIGEFEAILCIP